MTAVPETETSEVIDLDALADFIPAWATTRGLALVPVVPDSYDEVLPAVYMTAEHMTPEAFVDLAATAGARLLYSCTKTFDLASLDLEEDETQRLDVHTQNSIAAVRHRASAYQGRCCDVHLAFAADGVLHSWKATQAPGTPQSVKSSKGHSRLSTRTSTTATAPLPTNRSD